MTGSNKVDTGMIKTAEAVIDWIKIDLMSANRNGKNASRNTDNVNPTRSLKLHEPEL